MRRSGGLTLLTLLALVPSTAAPAAPFVAPEIEAAGDSAPSMALLLTWDHPPTTEDAYAVELAGGVVRARWTGAAWTMLVDMRPVDARALVGRMPGLAVVEPNRANRTSLVRAVRTVGARAVWHGEVAGPSATGRGVRIAIIDSGLEPEHPDLAGRVVGWVDLVDESPAAIDRTGHGTGVASAAAGTGAGFGWTPDGERRPTGYRLDLSNRLPGIEGNGFERRFSARLVDGPAEVLTWLSVVGQGGLHDVLIRTGDRAIIGERRNQAANPLIARFDVADALAGAEVPDLIASAYSVRADGLVTGGRYYRMRAEVPFTPVEDAPLWPPTAGAAPGAELVGVRTQDAQGRGNADRSIAAIEWVFAHAERLGIGVVNASFNTDEGERVIAEERAVDRLVGELGVVFVGSAGNDQGDGFTGSTPASADLAISVGAIDPRGAVTDYSSLGDRPGKPDVVAPGGSIPAGTLVVADANQVPCKANGFGDDCPVDADVLRDDYRTVTGTSYASPLVAGVVAQMLEADGGVRYEPAQALRIKALLLATATEVGDGVAASPGRPGRGDDLSDQVEGHGLIDARAAVEAIAARWPDGTLSLEGLLGGAVDDRRSWARRLDAGGGEPLELVLSAAPGADYDLYIFRDVGDARGQPILVAHASTPEAGAEERVVLGDPPDAPLVVVVKRVAGEGPFTLERRCAADGLGDRCVRALDACSSEGRWVCDPHVGRRCDAAPIEPADEACNGADDDCDGATDEGFRFLGEPCVAGIGGCAVAGRWGCNAGGGAVTCDAVPGRPVDEACADGIDDDCDGVADEGCPVPDVGAPDAAGPDAAAPDAAVPDVRAPDAAAPDAGPVDASAPDMEPADAVTPDMAAPAPVDAALDALAPDTTASDAQPDDLGLADADIADAMAADAMVADAMVADAMVADAMVDDAMAADAMAADAMVADAMVADAMVADARTGHDAATGPRADALPEAVDEPPSGCATGAGFTEGQPWRLLAVLAWLTLAGRRRRAR